MSLSSPLIVPSFLPFSSLSFLFLVFFFVLFSTLLLCQVGPYFHSVFSSIYSPLSSVLFSHFLLLLFLILAVLPLYSPPFSTFPSLLLYLRGFLRLSPMFLTWFLAPSPPLISVFCPPLSTRLISPFLP